MSFRGKVLLAGLCGCIGFWVGVIYLIKKFC
jgi:hypothetical protein